MEKIDSNKPNIIISGGGPSGLLTAILLANIGIESTVIEKAPEADQWSTKSYTIVIGERASFIKTRWMSRYCDSCWE